LEEILQFLPCETPPQWIDFALTNQETLLVDHANCEKKAASNAMHLLYRYTSKPELMIKMSQLAREEILHFQQVVEILREREIEYVQLSPSRYANQMRKLISHHEKWHLVDTLIVGAFIEARSCERFGALAPELDEKLKRFYTSLIKSESRHFYDYLELAQSYCKEDIGDRVHQFRITEEQLINSTDTKFRFHSGIPRSENALEL
tara:strand:- start:497 stop:1111 length:615 start_codon:yes stop_codon:yes gene_type:complete